MKNLLRAVILISLVLPVPLVAGYRFIKLAEYGPGLPFSKILPFSISTNGIALVGAEKTNGGFEIYTTTDGTLNKVFDGESVPPGQTFSGAAPTVSPVSITIGGVPVSVGFAGMVSAGLYQCNVTVPSLPSGDQPIEAVIDGVQTPANLFVTLQ